MLHFLVIASKHNFQTHYQIHFSQRQYKRCSVLPAGSWNLIWSFKIILLSGILVFWNLMWRVKGRTDHETCADVDIVGNSLFWQEEWPRFPRWLETSHWNPNPHHSGCHLSQGRHLVTTANKSIRQASLLHLAGTSMFYTIRQCSWSAFFVLFAVIVLYMCYSQETSVTWQNKNK